MKINKEKFDIKKVKQTKGITLIALVVTIIVLLILAGVSIAMLTGEGGILQNAREANDKTGRANAIEMAQLDVLEKQSSNEGKITEDEFKEILGRYFTINDEKENILESTLTTKDGKYSGILASEIYNGKFSESAPSGPQVPEGQNWDLSKVTPTEDEDKNVIPVPKGFYYVGGTVNTGVVISDNKNDTMENTAGANQGNQFVWVPVPNVIWDGNNVNDIVSGTYTPMATKYSYNDNTYYRGMLYEFGEGDEATKATYQKGDTVGTTSYREPSLVTGSNRDLYAPMTDITGTSCDAAEKNYSKAGNFSNSEAFGKQMQDDFNKMIESVDKYKGFYVARYEMSLNGTQAEYKKGKKSAINDSNMTNHWYDYYKIQKAFAEDTRKSSVISSMIWGSQYDAMMNWMARNNIPVGDSNIPGHTKNSSISRITGGASTDILNNVYDLLGNSYEWTLEACSTVNRVIRGGYHYGSNSPSLRRNSYEPTSANDFLCSRATLYMQV